MFRDLREKYQDRISENVRDKDVEKKEQKKEKHKVVVHNMDHLLRRLHKKQQNVENRTDRNNH